MSRPFRVSEETLGVLSRLSLSVEGGRVIGRITDGMIPRPLYDAVNRVLEALGGKWDRKARGHVFDTDPTTALDAVLLTGMAESRKQLLGFFETPEGVASRLVELAGVKPGMRVLEPSAGKGAIVRKLPSGLEFLSMVEVDESRKMALISAGPRNTTFSIEFGDFLTMPPEQVCGGPLAAGFDAIVMNPPFSNQADILHVSNALRFLNPGGRLAAVMSAGVRFREDRKTTNFKALLDRYRGKIEPLPEGTFRESGTDVHTVIVTAEKQG